MKPLNMWSEVEIKAGIYDRQNEIQILQNELIERANRNLAEAKERAEKVVGDNKKEKKA